MAFVANDARVQLAEAAADLDVRLVHARPRSTGAGSARPARVTARPRPPACGRRSACRCRRRSRCTRARRRRGCARRARSSRRAATSPPARPRSARALGDDAVGLGAGRVARRPCGRSSWGGGTISGWARAGTCPTWTKALDRRCVGSAGVHERTSSRGGGRMAIEASEHVELQRKAQGASLAALLGHGRLPRPRHPDHRARRGPVPVRHARPALPRHARAASSPSRSATRTARSSARWRRADAPAAVLHQLDVRAPAGHRARRPARRADAAEHQPRSFFVSGGSRGRRGGLEARPPVPRSTAASRCGAR